MAEPLYIPSAPASTEIRVVNSRFIASAAPAATVEAACAYIAHIRAARPNANHHVYAYVIGHGATTIFTEIGTPAQVASRVLRPSGVVALTVPKGLVGSQL